MGGNANAGWEAAYCFVSSLVSGDQLDPGDAEDDPCGDDQIGSTLAGDYQDELDVQYFDEASHLVVQIS